MSKYVQYNRDQKSRYPYTWNSPYEKWYEFRSRLYGTTSRFWFYKQYQRKTVVIRWISLSEQISKPVLSPVLCFIFLNFFKGNFFCVCFIWFICIGAYVVNIHAPFGFVQWNEVAVFTFGWPKVYSPIIRFTAKANLNGQYHYLRFTISNEHILRFIDPNTKTWNARKQSWNTFYE